MPGSDAGLGTRLILFYGADDTNVLPGLCFAPPRKTGSASNP
jgi:hypothetical protein